MNTSDPSKYDFTRQIGFLLRRAYQRHVAIFQQTLPESQLTAAQFVVLLTARDHGPCEVPAIVEATSIDEASVRGIVERLWRKLLHAEHEPGDATMLVSLAPAGHDLLERTVPFAQQSPIHLRRLIPRAGTLVALLRKMSGTGAWCSADRVAGDSNECL
jgi:DNA-binding MarR family transcriptional regulator